VALGDENFSKPTSPSHARRNQQKFHEKVEEMNQITQLSARPVIPTLPPPNLSSSTSSGDLKATVRERQQRLQEKVQNWQRHMDGLRQQRQALSLTSDRVLLPPRPDAETRPQAITERAAFTPEMATGENRFSVLHHRMAVSENSLNEISTKIRGNLSAIRQSIMRISVEEQIALGQPAAIDVAS